MIIEFAAKTALQNTVTKEPCLLIQLPAKAGRRGDVLLFELLLFLVNL